MDFNEILKLDHKEESIMATVFGKTYRTIKSKLYSKRLIEIEQTALNVFYLDLHQHAFK